MTDVLTRELSPNSTRDRVRSCVSSARQYLLSLQHEEGWWKGELDTNVTMEAEDLLLRQFLGISDEQVTQETARWIRSCQREEERGRPSTAVPPTCPRPWRPTSRCAWQVMRWTPRTCARRVNTSWTVGGSSPHG